VRRYYQNRGFGWMLVDISEEQYEQDLRPDWSVAYRYIEKVDEGKERVPLYKLKKPAVERLFDQGEVERCQFETLPPCAFKIDEAGDYFAKMSGKSLGPCYPYYQRMKRKIGIIGDDTTMACQYAKQIDLELREQANDWMFLVNWAARRRGIFYLPAKATWAKFPTLPRPGDSPMLTGFFSIDGKSWGRTYDTSAGVGIEGGFAADKGQKVGGISWMWVFPAALLVIFLLKQLPDGLSGTMTWFLHRNRPKDDAAQSVASMGATNPAVQVNTNRPLALAALGSDLLGVKGAGVRGSSKSEPEEEVFLTGTDAIPGSLGPKGQRILLFFFSDGSTGTSVDREFGGVQRGVLNCITRVKWDGVWINQRYRKDDPRGF